MYAEAKIFLGVVHPDLSLVASGQQLAFAPVDVNG